MTAAADQRVTDTIVIGGGLIGLSAALALRQQGMGVTLLEASTIARQASSASAGGVRSLNRDPAEIALARAALPLWSTLEKELGQSCGFTQSGQIRVAEDDQAFEALAARAVLTRNLGFEHEQLIDARELRDRIPQLISTCQGGLLVEDDGFADPLSTVHAYRQACADAGVCLMEGVRVTAIEPEASGLRLHCSHVKEAANHSLNTFEYRCRQCVNAAGAWGGVLSASIGEPVPIRPVALQMAVTEPVPEFVKTVVGCQGRKLSLKQTSAGAVIIGGGFEGHVHSERHDGLRGIVNQERAAENTANVARLFPHLRKTKIVRQWAGIEGMVDDNLPVLGQSVRLPGLIHAFGFSGHGFALVPVVGPLVAAIAVGRRVNLPIDAFAIDRFVQNESVESA
jgi:sarcosine oxidase subunit beta